MVPTKSNTKKKMDVKWAIGMLICIAMMRMLLFELPISSILLPVPQTQPSASPTIAATSTLGIAGYHETTLTHVFWFVDDGPLEWNPHCSANTIFLQLVIVASIEYLPSHPHIDKLVGESNRKCFAAISTCPLPRSMDALQRKGKVEFVLNGGCTIGQDVGYALFLFGAQHGGSNDENLNAINWLNDLAAELRYPAPLVWIVSGPVKVFENRYVGRRREASLRPIIYRISSHPTKNSVVPIAPHERQHDSFPYFYFSQVNGSAANDNQTVVYPTELEALWDFAARFKEHYDVIRFQLAHRIRFTNLLPGDFALPPLFVQQQQPGLTHVVFSLPLFQLNTLRQNIRKNWEANPPCLQQDLITPLPHLILLIALNSNTSLLFDEPALQGEVQHLLLPYSHCFAKITICRLDLQMEDDTRVYGSKLLFESFLNRMCVPAHEPFGFALYLEPDVKPVKPQWLTALARTASSSTETWIIGSMFLGNIRFVKEKWLPRKRHSDKLYFHLNGNALYWLGNSNNNASSSSSPLRDFYFNQVKPFIQEKHKVEGAKLTAMDLDFFEYVFHSRHNIQLKNQFVNRIQYTELIGNFYFENGMATDQHKHVLVHAKPSKKWGS